MKRPTILKISQLERTRRMCHDVQRFHETQLKEKNYINMVNTVSKITFEKIRETPKDELNLVEIGAGSGILSLRLVDMLINSKKKIRLIISEPDLDLLSYAFDYVSKKVSNKAKFERMIKSKRIIFAQIKAQDIMRLKLKHIDIIVSSEVFHHIPYHQKTSCIRTCLKLISPKGYLIIGDNFVADKYNYLKNNGEVITQRKIIAPKVAKLLEHFWTKLFKGDKWPESFKLAYEQQKKGFVECKTSLPHLLKIILKAKGKVIQKKILTNKINENGGYAVLVVV